MEATTADRRGAVAVVLAWALVAGAAAVVIGCSGSGGESPKVGDCVNGAGGPGLPAPKVVSCNSSQAFYRVTAIEPSKNSFCPAPAINGYSFDGLREWCLGATG